MPAILGGGTSGEIEALRTYGLNVGVAFQIQDDVRDIDEDTGLLEQPGASPRMYERLLLPLLYLERYGSPTAIRHYRQMLHTEAWKQGQLTVLLREEDIFGRIQRTQDRYLAVALQALDSLRPSDAHIQLSMLASYAVDHRAQFHPGSDRTA